MRESSIGEAENQSKHVQLLTSSRTVHNSDYKAHRVIFFTRISTPRTRENIQSKKKILVIKNHHWSIKARKSIKSRIFY